MRIRSMVIAALVILCWISICLCQEASRNPRRSVTEIVPNGKVVRPSVPDIPIAVSTTQIPIAMFSEEPNSWGIHISTTGGFDGLGQGALSLNWKGDRFSSLMGSSCRAGLSKGDVEGLFQAAVLADLFGVSRHTVSICHDCYTTTLSLYRRDSNGVVRSRSFTWDQVSAGLITPAVRAVYDKAVALKDCRN